MRRWMFILLTFGLCGFFFVLGAWQKSGYSNREYGKGDRIALRITKDTECSVLTNLIFETHRRPIVKDAQDGIAVEVFDPCISHSHLYIPCQDPVRAMGFPKENMEDKERHCPPDNEKLRCLLPAPEGYLIPFHWPKSRDYVPYASVPYKSFNPEKVSLELVQLRGNFFRFPGRGAMFPRGADVYIEELSAVIPMSGGSVRTALDIGCVFASWGAYLLKRNIISMSFAPVDSHNPQIHFALERGIPAVIGVLGTMKLPYPSRAFDIVHCSHCQVPWSSNSGMYMMEVDRVLRPGGYFVLSGPLINLNLNYLASKLTEDELHEEHKKIQSFADLLCWEKEYENEGTAIWKKKMNAFSCSRSHDKFSINLCESTDADNSWYKKILPCINPFLKVNNPEEISGGQLKNFPERLSAVPPRISQGYVPGITAKNYEDSNNLWMKRVKKYKTINKWIGSSRYNNIMDMNAGFGGFAAALLSKDSWVMNVVPTISQVNTLGIIYERGLIGIYHDWCEAFSTYPRTYDFIHASELFSLYQRKCSMEDVLFEMDRILRPEGTVIIHDSVDVVTKLQGLARSLRWNTSVADDEDGNGPITRKILVAVKTFWTSNVTLTSA